MRNILILLIIFISNIMLGQEQSIERILKAHFTNLNHIECNYKQEKELSMLNEPLISAGIFKYEKEGNISWEQQTPFKETFLINGKSNNKFDKHINQFIVSILTGNILNNNKLDVSYSEDELSYIIVMTPKKGTMKKKLKEIILTFHKEIVTLSQLEIISQNGDVSRINFFDN
ncbi:MAG: outer membrane lipoprotein carrier protein LolA [Flavobacteriales bacterium]